MTRAQDQTDEQRIEEFTSRILHRVFFHIIDDPDCDGTVLFPEIEEELKMIVAETRGDFSHIRTPVKDRLNEALT